MNYFYTAERTIDDAFATVNKPAIQQACKCLAVPGCIGAAYLLAPQAALAKIGVVALGALAGTVLFANTSRKITKIKKAVLSIGTIIGCGLYGAMRGAALAGPIGCQLGGIGGFLVGYPLGIAVADTLGANTAKYMGMSQGSHNAQGNHG